MQNILLVCTGNTCRSSMAEGILKYILQEYKEQHIQVKSAGTSVFFSESANEKAVIVMQEMGIDICMHMSQPLNEMLLLEADLILTMTTNHKESVLRYFPKAKEKVFTLREHLTNLIGDIGAFQDPDFSLERSNWDIPDPYGRSLEEYRQTALEIKHVLEKIVKLTFD